MCRPFSDLLLVIPAPSQSAAASSLPPRPAGPAPIQVPSQAAVKQQVSPVNSLELKLTGPASSFSDTASAGGRLEGHASGMSPRTPAGSPTGSPTTAQVFTPGGSGPMGATQNTTKMGVLNLIKKVDQELAVKKKEMDAIKKAWKASQEDFEERRQEHDDAEEQLLQAIEEKRQREEAALAGKRKRVSTQAILQLRVTTSIYHDIHGARGR